MACGSLVVGFTGGGGAEFARDDNGFWVPDEDPLALAECLANVIKRVKANDPTLQSIRNAARLKAETFNFSSQKTQLLSYWEQRLSETTAQSE